MINSPDARRLFSFVTCANDPAVLRKRLLASPCLAEHKYDLAIYLAAASAADAFNAEMKRRPNARWLVWVHQDVFLPQGWDNGFAGALAKVEEAWPSVAVVGVYGIAGAQAHVRRAGHLLDRGVLLGGDAPLPCRADSIDELLFAVRIDTGLMLDPALGFHFYGTDLALAARQSGFEVVVVDAYCEHWSQTDALAIPETSLRPMVASGEFFEKKWAHRLPVVTPCCAINVIGDVQRLADAVRRKQRDQH